jgi:hypothetical protein
LRLVQRVGEGDGGRLDRVVRLARKEAHRPRPPRELRTLAEDARAATSLARSDARRVERKWVKNYVQRGPSRRIRSGDAPGNVQPPRRRTASPTERAERLRSGRLVQWVLRNTHSWKCLPSSGRR